MKKSGKSLWSDQDDSKNSGDSDGEFIITDSQGD